ncbi:MFS transporter cpaT-like protein [Cladobotryum mycophilum]|uniref:MFS transporter cpaT-like protein n=1 Tax=Cladobotryum mycophilum TaxID=491253 RepID=A0ABR0SVZ5_9HYPO
MEAKKSFQETALSPGDNSAMLARGHVRHTQIQASHLYRKDENGNVQTRVLIPRPTNDPKDPLTWSPWRKHMAFASISFYVWLSNYGVSAVTPGFEGIIEEFGVTANQCSYLVTLQLLLLGLGNLFWIPLSLKYGKRPICIISSALFFATFIWSAVAKSYGSLLASRIVSGFAGSVSEVMAPAVVADVYFLHERATMTGIATFMIGGGSALGGIFGGLVVNASSDWRWIFWMCSIMTGTCFVSLVLCYQETNFARPPETEGGDDTDVEHEVIKSTYSFTQAFNMFAWHDRETSLWLYFVRPLPLLLYPAIFWAAVSYGVTLGWVACQSTANATFFPALYHFSPLGVGNLYVANVIGAVLGCIYSGPICDWVVGIITKRNGGYFKPEYRLYLMIPPSILGPVGLLMWGFGLHYSLHWSVAAVGSGISYAMLCIVPNIGLTYIIDAYRPVAGEAITSLTAFKNTVAFGLGFATFPWLHKSGPARVAGYQTLIEGLVFLTTVPLFIYGERLRRWCSQFDI